MRSAGPLRCAMQGAAGAIVSAPVGLDSGAVLALAERWKAGTALLAAGRRRLRA